jgi:hypothetical protein
VRVCRALVAAGLGLGLGGLTFACLPRQTSEQREAALARNPEQAAAPTCGPSSEASVALLDAREGCGLMLELDGARLRVRPRPTIAGPAKTEVVAEGPAPERCGEALELCELEGVADPLGPIVIASERGPESEVPVQVHLGWVADERLVFVETWYGLPSVVDHTRVGPPWVLAPHDCDGELVLLPAPRLPEAEGEAPSDELRALAGVWTIDADGVAHPPASPSTVDPSSCRPLLDTLP